MPINSSISEGNITNMPQTTAFVALDLIGDIVHQEGRLAGKGYAVFARERDTIDWYRSTSRG